MHTSAQYRAGDVERPREAAGAFPAASLANPLRSWTRTDRGSVRAENQDSLVSRPGDGLWMVADGVGGHAGGAQAARAVAAALEALPGDLPDDDIRQATECALQNVHHALQAARLQAGNAASATTVVVLLLRGDRVTCLWAGDSRAYRFRDGRLALITRDHSLVQEMLSAGTITPEQARRHPRRNVITRALGADCNRVAIECVTEHAQPGDLYLLCTDGLPGALTEAEIARVMAGAPEHAADALVCAALERQARDNVTVAVIAIPAAVTAG